MKKDREELITMMFEGLADNYNKLWKLAAIWLEKPLKTSIEKKRRITKGDLVKVDNGQLIDCNDEPTHKILECYGNMANTFFKLELENLSTNEIYTIEI